MLQDGSQAGKQSQKKNEAHNKEEMILINEILQASRRHPGSFEDSHAIRAVMSRIDPKLVDPKKNMQIMTQKLSIHVYM